MKVNAKKLIQDIIEKTSQAMVQRNAEGIVKFDQQKIERVNEVSQDLQELNSLLHKYKLFE
jgi:hypothetical protein